MWRIVPWHGKLYQFLQEFFLGNINMKTHTTILYACFQNLQNIITSKYQTNHKLQQIMLKTEDCIGL